MCGLAGSTAHEPQTQNLNGEQGINPQTDVGHALNKRESELHPMGQLSASGANSAIEHSTMYSTMKTKNLTEQSRILNELLRERILVLDGAMGTMIQKRDLSAADFGGAKLEGCNENLVLTRPDVISDIHRIYLEAGADIIETNSFGSTSMVLAEYGLGEKAYEISTEVGGAGARGGG